MEFKKELGWQIEGLFLLNEGILHRQMDKRYVSLAKNMHVKLLN